MIKETIKNLSDKAHSLISSNQFFIATLVLFVLQAGWLAASAAYPMLYDEYYHPGLIDVYSEQLSPFINSQASEQTAVYMDITRVPSYLYHYLLSYPYRLITYFTDSFYVAIVSLRLINVAFVAGGLILFRKLLREAGFSKAIVHASLLFLTLLPIFPHVAAHVNYDNLLFLLTPIFLLYGLKNLRNKSPSFTNICLFISIGLLASIVKFSFLPILATAVIYVTASLLKKHKSKLLTKIYLDFKKLKTVPKITICIFLLAITGLFTERYLGNLVVYSSIQPACERIHPSEHCFQQPVLQRNNRAAEEQKLNRIPIDNLIDYTRDKWLPAMVEISATTAVNTGSEESFGYTVKGSEGGAPVPVLLLTFWIMLTVSLVFVSYSWREIRYMPNAMYFFSICTVYLLSVWILTNYASYRELGQAFAMQPRYFILLMPIVLAYITQAVNIALSRRLTKVLLFIGILVMFTQGGGVSTYVIRSNEGWYWQRETIINTNMKIKRAIAPYINEQ